MARPGAVDFAEGKVIFAPNMEGWKDVPLKKDLEKQLGVPVFVENDCNICALGVHVAELKGKPKSLIGIFVGTGIGGGLIINGDLYGGFNHTAGEIGHMVLDVNGPKCGCGNKGCFEALASRTAIFQQIKAGIKDGEKTLLTEMLGDDLADLRSGDLRKAIRRGDKFVDKVIEGAAEYIGIGIANLVNILSPEVVVRRRRRHRSAGRRDDERDRRDRAGLRHARHDERRRDHRLQARRQRRHHRRRRPGPPRDEVGWRQGHSWADCVDAISALPLVAEGSLRGL